MGSAVARNVFLGVDWLIAGLWAARSLQWMRGLSLVPDLRDEQYAPRAEEAPKLTVIVPARNEQEAIAACLRSLLASTGVRLEILAVDDRSTDATGRIMDEIAAEAVAGCHALRVLHVTELPDGWMGKTHAMALAAAEATADWLLFTDGDMQFAPEALARAVRYAAIESADHVILFPTMIFKTFGERMMLAFLHAMSIWGPRPWKVADPAAKQDFIGIGAFNLIRRPVYEAIGGWKELRLEVLEDLRMGYLLKRAGYRQRAVFGRDLTRIRWAEGAIGVVNGMAKNLFAVFRFRLPVAAVAMISVFALCLLPLAGLGLRGSAWWAFFLMLTALSCLYARYARFGLPGVLFVLTFPIGAVLFVFALGQSIALTLLRQGVRWRGTLYPLTELRRHAGPLR